MDEQGAGEKRDVQRENAARPLSSSYPSDTRAFWVGKAQDLLRELSTNCFSFRKRRMVLQVGTCVTARFGNVLINSTLARIPLVVILLRPARRSANSKGRSGAGMIQ